MKPKKEYSFFLIIIAIVIGSTLYKQFNFETMTFEKPLMAIVYSLTLVMTLYFLIKGSSQKES